MLNPKPATYETPPLIEPGHTFTVENPLVVAEADWSRIPPRRIDYLMVRCDDRGPTLRIDSCERLFDQPVDGIRPSDHYGVAADLVPADFVSADQAPATG